MATNAHCPLRFVNGGDEPQGGFLFLKARNGLQSAWPQLLFWIKPFLESNIILHAMRLIFSSLNPVVIIDAGGVYCLIVHLMGWLFGVLLLYYR